MAYLGAIAKSRPALNGATYQWWTTQPLGGNRVGKIYGPTTEQNAIVPYALVRLYWQDDWRMIAQTISDATGRYLFSGLSTTQTNKYLVSAFKRVNRAFDVTANVVSYAHLTPSL